MYPLDHFRIIAAGMLFGFGLIGAISVCVLVGSIIAYYALRSFERKNRDRPN